MVGGEPHSQLPAAAPGPLLCRGHEPGPLRSGMGCDRVLCPARRGAEPCGPGEGGQGGLGRVGGKQSQQHRQHFTGRAAPRAGRGEHAKPGGRGGRQEGRAPRHHCGSAFRMAFTSSATAVSANSNWSWGSKAGGHEGPHQPSLRGRVCSGREGIPSLGGYLGLHHAGPLVSDVLQRSSYVYLLYTWGRGGKRVLGGGSTGQAHGPAPSGQGRSSAALHLPLAIRFRTMSTRMYVPVLPAPSLQDRDSWTGWTGSRD